MSRASLLHRIKAWFKAATLRQRFEHDMDEEIRFHLEAHTKTLVDQGVPEAEARRQARIAFGGAESSRDGVRHALGLRPLDELLADLRYAVRVLRNSPGFTLIAAGSLALAIGANTTIFSVAHFMLLERLAVPRATELRVLYHEDQKKSVYHMSWGSWFQSENGLSISDTFTYPVYQQMQQEARKSGLELFAFKEIGVNATFGGTARAAQAQMVTGNYFAAMQTGTALGRSILPSDDGAPGSGNVAVIGYSLWQRAFGGKPDVLGRTLRINAVPFTIVGVSAKGFTGATSVEMAPDFFLPMSMMATLHGTLGPEKVLQSTSLCWLQLMVRKPGDLSDEGLRTQLDHAFHTAVLATLTPAKGETVPRLVTEDGSRGLAQSARFLRHPIYVLLGMVGCVLLLACANIANLMLARAGSRQREISVRLALGAGRARVFRQLLVESLLLAAIGGSVGAALGFLGRAAAPAMLQNAWAAQSIAIPFNVPVFAFAAGLTILTGVLFGLAPAWQSTRTDVNTALKQGARSASRQRRPWAGKGLVALQVALATLLVAGSALFLRTMANLAAVHPGFQPQGLLLADVQPSDGQYPGEKSIALHHALLQRFAAVPGVDAATLAAVPLIAGNVWNSGMLVEGEKQNAAPDDDNATLSNLDIVTPEFFSVMQIPLLAGRNFNTGDTSTSTQVAIVNQAFVRKFFQNKNPIGLRISGGSKKVDGKSTPTWMTVIGVCADTQYADLRTAPGPVYFTNIWQSRDFTPNAMGVTYILRSRVPPASLAVPLKQAAAQIDPDLPLEDLRTEMQQIADVSRQERMFATLTAGFGLLALALACVGIYGIMAYTVSQRTHEIGIRLALGAARGRVRGMVLREATWLAVLGVALGLAAALALAKLVKSLLYGLEPRDPLSLTLAAALLLAVALSAAWLPAARAARLEPVIALRQD